MKACSKGSMELNTAGSATANSRASGQVIASVATRYAGTTQTLRLICPSLARGRGRAGTAGCAGIRHAARHHEMADDLARVEEHPVEQLEAELEPAIQQPHRDLGEHARRSAVDAVECGDHRHPHFRPHPADRDQLDRLESALLEQVTRSVAREAEEVPRLV